MAQEQTTRQPDRRGAPAPGGKPLRRATDSSLLDGHARPLTLGAVTAVVVGTLLAIVGPRVTAPIAFTLSSVVTIGLLGAARRADTGSRPDHEPDQSPRSIRVMALVVLLALIGTGAAAWTIAADLAR